jgi:hypothetical protein
MPRIVTAALALLLACGPKHSPPPGNGSDPGSAADGGSKPGSAPPSPTPLSRAECEQMIDHVLEVGMAQQRAQKAADYVPTEAQVAAIRQRLVQDQLAACLAWPRPQWDCVMASTTVETLYACAETAP